MRRQGGGVVIDIVNALPNIVRIYRGHTGDTSEKSRGHNTARDGGYNWEMQEGEET